MPAAALPAPVSEPQQRDGSAPRDETLVESYRRLADVFHHVLSEQSLDTLLERIADTLADLIPYDTLSIYQADEAQRMLLPVLARDTWAEEIMKNRSRFGEGVAGWAAEHREPVRTNQAHLDPRRKVVPGTPPDEPEALITIPLIARGAVKGVLNIYRLGEDASFDDGEFELAKRFGDAAALALDNAQIRARLEHQAQTDSLTGLYNHRFFHECLRRELTRASRSHDTVSVLMLDIDDFKRVNDVYGHGSGDHVLMELAELLKKTLRVSDVVCRLGGEEFGVIMTSGIVGDALAFARRLTGRLAELEFEPAGKITLSIGISQSPQHATNPRELAACAEAAMMTAKARGKDNVVVFDEETAQRPGPKPSRGRDVRSIAHLKMLQSLAGKLNRLNDVRAIGTTIANELRTLIDYHNCRIHLVEGDELVPIHFSGQLDAYREEIHDALRVKIGEGITGRVAATARSLLVRDALSCEFRRQVPGTHEIDESLIVVPLCYGARVIGVVAISKLGIDQFDEDDVRLLEVLAGQASVALENARLYEAQRREAENLKELLEFSRELATAESLEDVLARIVELSARMLGSPRTSVWLQEPETGDLVPTAVWGYGELEEAGILGGRFSAQTAHRLDTRAAPFVLAPDDVRQLEGAPEPCDESHFAVAPMKLDGDRLGCIIAALPATPGSALPEREIDLLAGLADQAKLALTNAGSFENLEGTFVSTIEALANALEANDEYTSSHTRWITDMALKVGAELGFDGRALKRLELSALFHDIGKIGVPTSILLKPGPLTPEERAVIEQHPELGDRILAPIERLSEVRQIVRACHEHFDGGGYPDGRHANEIPLEARIILVCDAFHAMTTDRPYRKRLAVAEACARLQASAGTQFDPEVVEVFLRLSQERGLPLHEARLAS